MSEREYPGINPSVPEKLKRFAYPVAGLVLAVAAASCGGDDSGDKDQDTATPFRTGVERTFTPTSSPTEEATLAVTALPTQEPTPEPTPVYVPPLVTVSPTLQPTQEPTQVTTSTPAPIPLELCNTGKFTNLAEEQTVYFYNDVRAQLAHEGNFDQGCDLPGNVGVNVVLVDTYGHEFRWALLCGYTYPISQPDWECFRDGVIISDVNGARWKMKLEIDNKIAQTLSVVKG